MLNQRIIYASLFYLLLIILVLVTKPPMVFDEHGNVRPFGVGANKTIFSLGVLTVSLSIISFYIFCLIDLIFANMSVTLPNYSAPSLVTSYETAPPLPPRRYSVMNMVQAPPMANLQPITNSMSRFYSS